MSLKKELKAKKKSLTARLMAIKMNRLSSDNWSYKNELASAENQIEDTIEWIDSILNKQEHKKKH